ncbi:MAG: metallophosphoesterase [Oscillospiraceae bacterium]|nr:metallophosphoesterase [Oscillospiraceae bacterium]
MLQPVLRFLVCSDVHYLDEPTYVRERFENFVRLGYDIAGQHESYKALDALYVVGDFLDTGTEEQFLAFKASLDKVIREGTKVVPLLGSHEFFHAAGEREGVTTRLALVLEPEFQKVIRGEVHAVERLRDILGTEEDTHFVLNGFHFITVSTTRVWSQWYDTYTPEKMDWLMTQLREAAADTPKKPVFLFQHPHIYGTVYGKDGWSKPELCLPLAEFPQIVDFSGHSHAPCTDPRSIYQKDFTCIGTGSISDVAYNEYDAAQGWTKADREACGQGLLVEADGEGNLRLLVLDPVAGVVRKEYRIDRPWDPDAFTYTEDRAKTEATPEFAADADITVTRKDGELSVTFPQAVGDTVQYAVNLRRKDGSVLRRIVTFAKQIYACPPETLTVDFGKTAPGEYTVDVRPSAPFGTRGKAIRKGFVVS